MQRAVEVSVTDAVIVPRERPQPGAQLTFSDIDFSDIDGWRFQAFAADTPRSGSFSHLEARYRAHSRVEDRIRCDMDTGFGRFPSQSFAINAVWLELALTAIDLLAWTQTMLCDGAMARCELKALRHRLLHVAARITRGQRRTFLRLAVAWPWARDRARAFAALLGLDPAAPRHENTAELPHGATLMLFTDGLVERHRQPIDVGLTQLRRVLSEHAAEPLDALCGRVLNRMLGGGLEDDVAIIAVRAYRDDQPRPPEAGPEVLPEQGAGAAG